MRADSDVPRAHHPSSDDCKKKLELVDFRGHESGNHTVEISADASGLTTVRTGF